MLEYSTLTGILPGVDARPLYNSVWLLAITWPVVNGVARKSRRQRGATAPTRLVVQDTSILPVCSCTSDVS